MGYCKELQDNKYYHSYKVRLLPNKWQKEKLNYFLSVSRKIYNWALNIMLQQKYLYDIGVEDTAYTRDIEQQFIKIKKTKEFSYFNDLTCCSGRQAVRRAEQAIDMNIRGKCGKPKFKSKKHDRKQSFSVTGDKMYMDEDNFRIPGFLRRETIKTDRSLGFHKSDKRKFYNPVISIDYNGDYWISFSIIDDKKLTYFEDNDIKPLNEYIGFDQNARNDSRIVLSNGTKFKFPDTSRLDRHIKLQNRHVAKDRKRLKQLQAKAKPGVIVQPSIKSQKRSKKLQILNTKKANINKNFINTTAKKIIDLHPLGVAGESLSVQEMNSRHYMSKFVHDCGFAMFAEAIKHKCEVYGIAYKTVDRYFASTQTCSRCGHIQKIYGNKIYICPQCGLRIDRDLNSAINIVNEAFK